MTARQEFRRSWRVVLAVMIGCCFGLGGVANYSFSVLINPMAAAFGCSLTAIGAMTTFNSIGANGAAPFIGRLVDRLGVRPVVFCGVPLFALALVVMGAVHGGIWVLWVASFFMGVFGVTTGSLAYSRAINGWFTVGRGIALGLMSAGIGIGAIFGPRATQVVVDAYGWRAGYFFLGAISFIALPLLILWLREPRDHPSAPLAEVETGYSFSQVLRLPLFWILGSASFLWLACFGGVIFLVPYLTSVGLTRAEAATVYGLLGLTSMSGRILTGWIMDRFPAAYVCGALFILEAAAFVALGLFQARFAAAAILAIGLAHGTENVGFAYCTARYFGLKSYSQISGLLGVISGLGLALAPLIFSSLLHYTAGYRIPYLTSASMAVGAAAIFVVIGRRTSRPPPAA